MSDHQEIWCQPSDQIKRQFIVMFDDVAMDVAAFDDEAEARAFWEKANIDWNCYLLGTLPRSEAATLIEALCKERDEARADHKMVRDLLDAAVIDYKYARNIALEEAAKIAEICHPQSSLLRAGIVRAIRSAATKVEDKK